MRNQGNGGGKEAQAYVGVPEPSPIHNIAQADRIERVKVGPIEVVDVNEAADRAELGAAVADAQELSTALWRKSCCRALACDLFHMPRSVCRTGRRQGG